MLIGEFLEPREVALADEPDGLFTKARFRSRCE